MIVESMLETLFTFQYRKNKGRRNEDRKSIEKKIRSDLSGIQFTAKK